MGNTKNEKDDKPVIVMYHNDMNTRLSLSSLSAVEIDIFLTIITLLRISRKNNVNKGDEPDSVVLTFDQLKELSHYSQRGDTRFKSYLINIYKKILSLHFVIDTEDSYTSFNLFSLFRIWDRKVMITINTSRSYIIDSLDSNFTMMKLKMITDIPTTAGKNLARLLSQYRSTGLAIIPMDGESGIRNQFGVEHWETRDITRRILKPSVQLVSKYFEGLAYEYVHEKGQGRKIKSVKFTFKPIKGYYDIEHRDDSKNASEAISDASTASKETGLICPVCGEPLIEREMNGKNVWCHADGFKKDAKCNRIFNTVAEIKGYSETPERSEKDIRAAQIVSEKLNECRENGKDLTYILESFDALD